MSHLLPSDPWVTALLILLLLAATTFVMGASIYAVFYFTRRR